LINFDLIAFDSFLAIYHRHCNLPMSRASARARCETAARRDEPPQSDRRHTASITIAISFITPT
jgi:hypothetical protein